MPDLLTEREFAGYRVESLIGRGGMGVVYRATDLRLERSVALKVLSEELARDEGFRKRFVSESKLAASLDHPNVIPIHAAGEHDGILYIAMRFVPGDDLRTILRANGRLAPGHAVALISQVAMALDAAHAHGLVHRDVKPANVLVTPEEHVYLTDFGLSKRLSTESQATRSGIVLGTLAYIAPEQIRGETIGPFTDVYSLGCLIAHVLTGEVPFPVTTDEGKMWAHFSEPPPRLRERVSTILPGFDPIVARAMDKRPEKRYQTAGEVAADLTAVLDAGGAPSKRWQGPSAVARAPRRPLRLRREALIRALNDPFNVVVLAALVVAGAVLGTLGLMLPLAVLVYVVGVVISHRRADG